MDEFIQLLETIEKLNLPDEPDKQLNQLKELSGIIGKILAHANTKLIDDNGRNIWENHTLLNEHGFQVFPGEQDRFGWLTGCIGTKKGYVLYG